MDKELIVSIIIPVYNVEPYLNECLDSIFNQKTTYPYEVITVNDASTDNSLAVLNEYARHRDNMIVIDQENKGPGGARNTGIDAASGKYIVFVDADDFLAPDSFQSLLEYAAHSDVDIAAYNYFELDESKDGKITEQVFHRVPEKGTGEVCYSSWERAGTYRTAVWTHLVRTEFLKENEVYFVDVIHGQDIEWRPRLFFFAKKVEALELSPYVHRKSREGSITTVLAGRSYFHKLTIIDNLDNFRERCGEGLFSDALGDYIAYIHTVGYERIYGKNKLDGLYEELRKRAHVLSYAKNPKRRALYLSTRLLPKKPLFILYDFLRKLRG